MEYAVVRHYRDFKKRKSGFSVLFDVGAVLHRKRGVILLIVD